MVNVFYVCASHNAEVGCSDCQAASHSALVGGYFLLACLLYLLLATFFIPVSYIVNFYPFNAVKNTVPWCCSMFTQIIYLQLKLTVSQLINIIMNTGSQIVKSCYMNPRKNSESSDDENFIQDCFTCKKT